MANVLLIFTNITHHIFPTLLGNDYDDNDDRQHCQSSGQIGAIVRASRGCHQPRIVIGFPYKVKGRDSNGDDGDDWEPRISTKLLIVMSMIMVRLGDTLIRATTLNSANFKTNIYIRFRQVLKIQKSKR